MEAQLYEWSLDGSFKIVFVYVDENNKMASTTAHSLTSIIMIKIIYLYYPNSSVEKFVIAKKK